MEFKDRVANKPNRVKLTYDESGDSTYATVELADEPIEEGTLLNATNMNKLLNKEDNDYIVEQGTHGIWYYEKWASGKCKLSGTDSRNVVFSDSNQQGSLYRSNVMYADLPFLVYNYRAFFDCTDVNAWASTGPTPNPTSAAVFCIWRGFPYELIEYHTHIYITGRWKQGE
jgi:hypothetical protein